MMIVFIIKATNQEKPDKDTYRAISGRVLHMELLGPLLVGSGHNCPADTAMCSLGSLTELWCPEFLLGFHYLGIIKLLAL